MGRSGSLVPGSALLLLLVVLLLLLLGSVRRDRLEVGGRRLGREGRLCA